MKLKYALYASFCLFWLGALAQFAIVLIKK